MKPCFPNRSRMTLTAVCGFAFAAAMFVFPAQADEWDKKTVLTVSQPIQITDTYLEPGTYVLKLASSDSDRHIVQIFNADQSHIINTVLAIPNYRLQPTGHSRFMFWETPPGNARAMRAWFYPGDNFGQEFRYPKQLRQIAMVQTQTQSAQQSTITSEAATTTTTAQPEPEARVEQQADQPVNQVTKQEETVIAQNNPPPAPAEPQATPAPALPQTATPYPLAGLVGLLSLGFYFLVRSRRLA